MYAWYSPLRSATAWVTLVPVPVDSEPKNRPKQEPTIKAIRHISRMITTAIQPPAAMAAINPFTAAMVAFMAVAVTLTAALTPVTVAFAAALAAWAAAFAAFAVAWAVLCATLADLCAVLMLLAPCLTPFRVLLAVFSAFAGFPLTPFTTAFLVLILEAALLAAFPVWDAAFEAGPSACLRMRATSRFSRTFLAVVCASFLPPR